MSGIRARVSGRRFREARKAALLSQKAVADAAKVSLPTIERIERGERKGEDVYVRPATLFDLAGALDVDPRELMAEGNSRPLGELGSPLDQARLQAARLERREAGGKDKLDVFWGNQWAVAKACVDATATLVRNLGDEVGRMEAIVLLERFIGLERRALEHYLALHGWSTQDMVSEEALDPYDRQIIEANA